MHCPRAYSSGMDNGTTGKKPLAPCAGKQPAGPITLGNMRSPGPRSPDVTCNTCGDREIINVDTWPDKEPVPAVGPRMRCTKCGTLAPACGQTGRNCARRPG